MSSEGVPLAGIPAAGSLVTANPLYPAGIVNPFYNAVPLGSVQTTTQKVESPNATTEQKTVTGPAGTVTTTKSDDKATKTTSEDTKSSTSPSVVHFLLQNHHIFFDYVLIFFISPCLFPGRIRYQRRKPTWTNWSSRRNAPPHRMNVNIYRLCFTNVN